MKALIIFCSSVLICGRLALQLSAATITLHPTADTTIQELLPNSNFGDGTSFTSGGRRGGGVTRALMEFDIAGNLPAGAMIDSASLTVTVIRTPSFGPSSIFDLNRLLASWGEGIGNDMGGTLNVPGATWINRFGTGGSPWTTPGGDFLTTSSGSRTIAGSGSYIFNSTASMVADVQFWLDNPTSNFGWMLRSESEALSTTIRRFGSHEEPLTSPVLTLSYAVVPEPAMVPLSVLAAAVIARWRRAPPKFL